MTNPLIIHINDLRKALRLHKKTSFDKCINTTIKTIKAITSKGESQ